MSKLHKKYMISKIKKTELEFTVCDSFFWKFMYNFQ